MTTVIARTATRLVVPIILVTSIALLLQGHNLPGGGFIAAVLTATAFALVYVVFGLAELARLLDVPADDEFRHGPIDWYRGTLAAGLGLAATAGLVPLVFDQPFLTQTFWIFHEVPIYHELEVASSIAFDLGVYLTVVGSLLTVLAVVGTE